MIVHHHGALGRCMSEQVTRMRRRLDAPIEYDDVRFSRDGSGLTGMELDCVAVVDGVPMRFTLTAQVRARPQQAAEFVESIRRSTLRAVAA